jgi:hypothetical protein
MHIFIPNYRFVIDTLMSLILIFLNIEVIDLTLKNDLQYLCIFILKYIWYMYLVYLHKYIFLNFQKNRTQLGI